MYTMQHYPSLFITLLTLVTLLFLGLIFSSLFFPLFWAVVFAIVFSPLYESIRRRLISQTWSALATLLLILVFVFTPIALLGSALAYEARDAYNAFSTQATSGFPLWSATEQWLGSLEQYGMETDVVREKLTSFGETASSTVASYAASFGRATAETMFGSFIMLYVLFFLLRDGESIGIAIKKAFPLDDADEQFLFNRFAEMTRAMFKGTLIVALVQGLIGGILFLLAGIESPLLWALVMTLFAVIPGVGPALVWMPAGVILLLSGALVPALIVLIGGATVLSYIDNVLRPILIGRDTRMPDVLVFVSVLAGLSVFGITGLVIGPALAALTLAFWELYARG